MRHLTPGLTCIKLQPGWENKPLNPSYQGTRLHQTVLLAAPRPLASDIPAGTATAANSNTYPQVHITYYHLPTSYPHFDTHISKLHECGEYDAFLHIGRSADHKKIKLETRARRVGYGIPYPDGLQPTLMDKEKGNKGHGLPRGEADEEDEYKPVVDLDGMERWLKDYMGIEVWSFIIL